MPAAPASLTATAGCRAGDAQLARRLRRDQLQRLAPVSPAGRTRCWIPASPAPATLTTAWLATARPPTTTSSRATNGNGDGDNSPQASATPTAVADLWASADIGAFGVAGSSSHAGNIFSVSGSGADIWGNADAVPLHLSLARRRRGDRRTRRQHQRHRPLGQERADDVRESLAAGAKNVLVAVTPGNGVTSQERPTTGGATDNTAVAGFAAPYWLKLHAPAARSLPTVRRMASSGRSAPPTRSQWRRRSGRPGRHGPQQHADQRQHIRPRLHHAQSGDEPGQHGRAGRNRPHVDTSLDAQSYTIKRATTSGGPYTTIATGVIGSAYNDTTAVGSDPYYYVVTAVNPPVKASRRAKSATSCSPTTSPARRSPTIYLRRNGANLQLWIGGVGDGSGPPTYSTLFPSITSLQFAWQRRQRHVHDRFAGGSPVPSGGLSIDGGGGSGAVDSLVLLGTTGADTFTIDASNIANTAFAGTIAYANMANVEFDLLGGNDSLTQTSQPGAAIVAFNGGASNDALNVNGGSFAFTTDAGATSANLTVNLANAGSSASFTGAQHLAALNISVSAAAAFIPSASPASPGIMNVTTLSLSGGSRFDIGNNELLTTATLSYVRSAILAGQLWSSSGTGGSARLIWARVRPKFGLR